MPKQEMTKKERRKIFLCHCRYYAAVAALYSVGLTLVLCFVVVFYNALFTPGYLGVTEAIILGMAGPVIYDIFRAANRWANK